MAGESGPMREFEARVEAAGTHKTARFEAAGFEREDGGVFALDDKEHVVYYAERERLVDIVQQE